jgi:hypothetical protein
MAVKFGCKEKSLVVSLEGLGAKANRLAVNSQSWKLNFVFDFYPNRNLKIALNKNYRSQQDPNFVPCQLINS